MSGTPYDTRPPMASPSSGSSTAPDRGGLVLALGLLGIVVCPIVAPIAWIMGGRDLAAMRAGTMDSSSIGVTKAGYVLGIVGCVLFFLFGIALFAAGVIISLVLASNVS